MTEKILGHISSITFPKPKQHDRLHNLQLLKIPNAILPLLLLTFIDSPSSVKAI
jgi:hypothetical protein